MDNCAPFPTRVPLNVHIMDIDSSQLELLTDTTNWEMTKENRWSSHNGRPQNVKKTDSSSFKLAECSFCPSLLLWYGCGVFVAYKIAARQRLCDPEPNHREGLGKSKRLRIALCPQGAIWFRCVPTDIFSRYRPKWICFQPKPASSHLNKGVLSPSRCILMQAWERCLPTSPITGVGGI